MFKLLKLMSWIAFSLAGIFIVHITITYLTPFPLNEINIVLLFLIWQYVYRAKDTALWTAFGLSFLLELFSGLPYGLTTFAIFCTLITTRAIFTLIFTNFSWVTIFLLGAVAVLIGDSYVYLFINAWHFFKGDPTVPFSTLIEIVSKLFINGVLILLWYAIEKVVTIPAKKLPQF